MSFEVVISKILESMKEEIKKEENIIIINNDIIKPIVEKVIDNIYPYFIGASLVFMTMFVAVMRFQQRSLVGNEYSHALW